MNKEKMKLIKEEIKALRAMIDILESSLNGLEEESSEESPVIIREQVPVHPYPNIPSPIWIDPQKFTYPRWTEPYPIITCETGINNLSTF